MIKIENEYPGYFGATFREVINLHLIRCKPLFYLPKKLND